VVGNFKINQTIGSWCGLKKLGYGFCPDRRIVVCRWSRIGMRPASTTPTRCHVSGPAELAKIDGALGPLRLISALSFNQWTWAGVLHKRAGHSRGTS